MDGDRIEVAALPSVEITAWNTWVQAALEARPNLFTPFTAVNADDQAVYAPGGDDTAIRTLLTAKMAEYNEANVAMNLVLFQQVHIILCHGLSAYL